MTAKKNFPLRIDPKLFELLESWAADEFRSINGHIEYLLRESLRQAGRLKPKDASKDASKDESTEE